MAGWNQAEFDRLVEGVKQGLVSRRAFLARMMAFGFSLPMARALLATSTAVAAQAESQPQPTGTPKKGGQVIEGHSQEPTLFNPVLSNLEVDRGAQFSIFDSLWRIDQNAQFIPNLATEIPSLDNGGISKDGLTYTFKLRQDAKWHDGQPLTAKDVIFTHNKIMDPKVASPIKFGHDKVTKIEATDDYTITATLSESFAPFLIVWGDTYIIPEHILKDVKDFNTAEFNSTKPVGSGPFKFVNRTPGESITLEANPDYHGPGPYLDKLIIKYVPDLNQLFTQFKTGEIDVIGLQGITPDHYEEAQKLTDQVVTVGATAFVEFIYFNFGKPWFTDKAVRQALYYAMDKDNIINTVYYGVMSNSETYLAESSWANDPDLPKHEYNPDKAKQLLDEAGWTVGSDGIRAKGDVKLSFENSTTAGNQVREQAQQYLQQTWKDVGVEMKINNMPAAVIWGDFYTKSQFDTVMVGEISGVGGDPDATARFASSQIAVQTGAGKNYMQYKNPELDKLLEAGAKEVDQEKRKAIYYQVQEILREELPVLPIFHYNFIEGTKKGFLNYKMSAFTVTNEWNTYEWGWSE